MSQPLRHTGINTPASPNHWVTKSPRPCPGTRRVATIASHRHQHPGESQPLRHKAPKVLPRNPACPSHCVTQASTPQRVPTIASQSPQDPAREPGVSQPLRHTGINTPASPNHWVTKPTRPCPGTRRVPAIASQSTQDPAPRHPARPSHCVTKASTRRASARTFRFRQSWGGRLHATASHSHVSRRSRPGSSRGGFDYRHASRRLSDQAAPTTAASTQAQNTSTPVQ